MPSSEEELSRLLRESGIDVSTWGTGTSKSVRHLLAELHATECHLQLHGESSELLRAALQRLAAA
jgi:hypothetical protein